MKRRYLLPLGGVAAASLAVILWFRVGPARAQQAPPAEPAQTPQITGTPGSPAATTTINGEQLPPPPQPFGGQIERNAAQSTP